MSHCCYGDGWCERCQAYMGPQAGRVEARLHYYCDGDRWGRDGVVVRGATAPWSWASLPGLDYTRPWYLKGARWWKGVLYGWWLESERRPEPKR